MTPDRCSRSCMLGSRRRSYHGARLENPWSFPVGQVYDWEASYGIATLSMSILRFSRHVPLRRVRARRRGLRVAPRGRPIRLERQPMDLLILLVERRGTARLAQRDHRPALGQGRLRRRRDGRSHRDPQDPPGPARFARGTDLRRDDFGQGLSVHRRGRGGSVDARPRRSGHPPGAGPLACRWPRHAAVRSFRSERSRRRVAGAATSASLRRPPAGSWRIGGWPRLRLWRSGARWAAAIVPPRVSLAVLPFENLGNDPERDYVAAGLTEETGASLAQVDPEHLSVKGRTLRYKGTTKSRCRDRPGARRRLPGGRARSGPRADGCGSPPP